MFYLRVLLYFKENISFTGYEWIGWRNDTPGLMGKPVEIVFEFDTVRNFSAIILHTNNMFTKDVQVFVHAKVFFSIGGRHFSSEPVHFSYMPDTIMDHARDVTIKLHHRVGKYLKINLYFAVKWIMLSEISFVSGKFLLFVLSFVFIKFKILNILSVSLYCKFL